MSRGPDELAAKATAEITRELRLNRHDAAIVARHVQSAVRSAALEAAVRIIASQEGS